MCLTRVILATGRKSIRHSRSVTWSSNRDGKIDTEFRSNVAQCWPNTTWGRRGNNLQQMEKIEVADEDVVTTYHTMLDASRLMTEALIDWASKNQTLEMNAKASDAS